MRILLLARHAEAESNVEDCVSGIVPGGGLSPAGRNEARALGRALARQEVDLCALSEFRRVAETAEIALAGRRVPRLVLPELNEIRFGRFEGGALSTYREWAWSAPPEADCPGGGESRAAAAARWARALELLLAREEDSILAVTHALAVRYVVDAAEGRAPVAKMAPVPHGEAVRLDADAVTRAVALLQAWSASPAFSVTMA